MIMNYTYTTIDREIHGLIWSWTTHTLLLLLIERYMDWYDHELHIHYYW